MDSKRLTILCVTITLAFAGSAANTPAICDSFA